MPDITDIPDLGSGLLSVAIRSAVVYAFLVLALRIGGKREVGQLTTPDLVVLLIVANAVQNAMVGQNTSLLGGVVATITILVLARATQIIVRRSERVEHALVGQPRILVADGVLDRRAMDEEEIGHEELMAALREHGIETLDDVHLAVLEVDGSISVLSAGFGAEAGEEAGGVARPSGAAGPGGTTGGPSPRRAGHLPRPSHRIGRRGRLEPS